MTVESSVPGAQRVFQNIALIGSYVPRQCGIATFTKDLRDAIWGTGQVEKASVIAMDDTPESYSYPPEVAFQVRAFQRRDYITAAEVLNINRVDVTILQHEYGIFGGADGELVLDFAADLRMPLIVTLHTVLSEPSQNQARIVQELARRGSRLVVMSRVAKQLLVDRYGIRGNMISYVPHGIPDVPFVDPAYYKDQFGFEGRTVLLTFGLLSPGKGIEYGIRALPEIVAAHPSVLYVILGATHPHILKREGNAYRNSLERLAERLGVRDHVTFHNRFVTLDELCGYIGAADIYITPYLNKNQITSGTLAYAMGAGKACVSTPFVYAEEMLADGRGQLFPFEDHQSLAKSVNALLANELVRNSIRKRAYGYGRSMVWPEVGAAYLSLASEVIEEARMRPKMGARGRRVVPEVETIPEVSLRHLQTLTDQTGILQHAVCAIPDRRHGYCTDDNARALIAVLMHYDLYRDEFSHHCASTFLSFLHHAFNAEIGRFRNFMSFDRRWLEEIGSEDSHARALWSLGATAAMAHDQRMLSFAAMLFHQALPACERFTSPRAWAYALIGIHAYLRRFSGDTQARRVREALSMSLYTQFQENASPDWPWPENLLSYDNARLPQALILSGQWLPHDDMTRAGIRSLDWLVRSQMPADGRISLVGNRGWMSRDGSRACFDQQPIDALALVEACMEAHRSTQDKLWTRRARQSFGWFLGNNDMQAVMYDFQTGGCSDGLTPDGASLNQGAESLLAWLISLLTIQGMSHAYGERDIDRGEEREETTPARSN